jgi:hypothetical protein
VPPPLRGTRIGPDGIQTVTRIALDQVPFLSCVCVRHRNRNGTARRAIFMNHPHGPHGFDVFDESERSRALIAAALSFLQRQLGAAAET